MLDEKQFKDAVRRHLDAEGALDASSVLISELNIDHFQRRADLVLANGRLSAFEIKSERDSLTRLAGQMEVYCRNFESVTVVSSPKFTKKGREQVPTHVGLWEVTQSGDEAPKVRVIRQSRLRRLPLERALAFLTVNDLKRLIAEEGLARPEKNWRPLLIEAVRKLPAERIRYAARAALKRRYRNRSFEPLPKCTAIKAGQEPSSKSSPMDTGIRKVTPRIRVVHS